MTIKKELLEESKSVTANMSHIRLPSPTSPDKKNIIQIARTHNNSSIKRLKTTGAAGYDRSSS